MNIATFSRDHSGSWAYGYDFDEQLGWLILEEGEGQRDEATVALALSNWREGKPLPQGWYRLDRSTATKVVIYGIRQYGFEYFTQGGADGVDRDAALQQVILGSQVYM